MSVRSTLLAIGITIVVLIASHYFYGEFKYKSGHRDGVSSVVQDSVKVDTVFVEVEVIKYEWIVVKEAEVDTVDEIITYSTSLDSTFVVDKDTVAVLKQDISFTEGIFEILTNIEIRPIEKLIIKTEYKTIEVLVPESNPFYNTTVFGIILTLVLQAIVALAFIL